MFNQRECKSTANESRNDHEAAEHFVSQHLKGPILAYLQDYFDEGKISRWNGLYVMILEQLLKALYQFLNKLRDEEHNVRCTVRIQEEQLDRIEQQLRQLYWQQDQVR
jgi:hypothetical protein